jgi:hypothetical protein
LHDIDKRCYEILDRLVEQMKKKQGGDGAIETRESDALGGENK